MNDACDQPLVVPVVFPTTAWRRTANSATRSVPVPLRRFDPDAVTPGDLRMLRDLAREARLAAITARPTHTACGQWRKQPWIRKAFLEDSIKLLELLDTLARQVEAKVWADDDPREPAP